MNANIEIGLPFKWCEQCTMINLQTSKIFTEFGLISTHTCENADLCYEVNKARLKVVGEQ